MGHYINAFMWVAITTQSSCIYHACMHAWVTDRNVNKITHVGTRIYSLIGFTAYPLCFLLYMTQQCHVSLWFHIAMFRCIMSSRHQKPGSLEIE